MITVLKNGNALVNGVIEKKTIVLENGKISKILQPDCEVQGDKIVDCAGLYVFPGFIDTHIHGGGGGYSQNITEDSYKKIVKSQVRFGTTSILLTLIGASDRQLENACALIPTINDSGSGANIVGIHIEGPWISPKKIGYLDNALFEFTIDLEHARQIIEMCNGQLKIVTLAPELDNAEALISELRENNIVASCGHTEANYNITKRSIEQGISSFTHLWNMSGPIQSRDPGVVGAALESDAYIELVADGYHVHSTNIKNTLAIKKHDKVCLVTDAMIVTGTDKKTYSFMGIDNIQVINGRTSGPNNAIIGSVLTLDKAVQNVHAWTSIDLADIVKMVTENPAKLVGLYPQKGVIQEGSDADISIFSNDMTCLSTYVNGVKVFGK